MLEFARKVTIIARRVKSRVPAFGLNRSAVKRTQPTPKRDGTNPTVTLRQDTGNGFCAWVLDAALSVLQVDVRWLGDSLLVSCG